MILTEIRVDILGRENVSGMKLLQEECAVMLVVLTPRVHGVEQDSVSEDARDLLSVPGHNLLGRERIPILRHLCEFFPVG
jgi:hypothetical protein